MLQSRAITEARGKQHELWENSNRKDPMLHYDSKPGEGVSILTMCPYGMPSRCMIQRSREVNELEEESAGPS